MPVRRMRHASCAVRTPPWAALPAGAPTALPSVLVLGGACDGGGGEARREPPVGQERGEPVEGGLLQLTLHRQHGQRVGARLGSAPARPLCLLGARLAAPGGSALPGQRPGHRAPRRRLRFPR